MKTYIDRRMSGLAVAIGGLALITGCPPQPPPPPPPTAVLEGTWELTPTSATISDFLISFDANGEITRVEYTHRASLVSTPVNVVIDNPDFVNADSSVNGSDVEITASWAGVNNFQFVGTLNAEENLITGSVTYFIEVGNVQVTLPSTNAQLTKQ